MFDRRLFLRGASVLMGSAALGQVMTAFAGTPRKASYFNESEMRVLRALVDVILPATDSPAASAADTHYFIDLAIPACASPRARDTFHAGLKSFVNEAKLLAQFDHPSLVKVYRFWEANGTAYMVMPFYRGVTV